MESLVDFPPEILAMVMKKLEERELGSCSGVNQSWYHLVEWELRRRGKALYRWPKPAAEVGSSLCIAGDVRSLRGAASICKGVSNLEIYMDSPCILREHLLSQLIHPDISCLILSNAIVDVKSVEIILNSNVSSLKILLNHRRNISKHARNLLLDHKELFENLIISFEKPSYTFQGYFPNPRRPKSLKEFFRGRVMLDATGLENISLANKYIVDLNIENAHSLSNEELDSISELPLMKLSVRGCNISTGNLNRSLAAGFNCLKSLSILDSLCINSETIQRISQLSCLEKLFLDLRSICEIEQALNQLKELINLKLLVVHYSRICDFKNIVILNTYSSNVKFIIFRNYIYYQKAEVEYAFYSEKCKLLNIHFKYIHEQTSISSSHTFQRLCKC